MHETKYIAIVDDHPMFRKGLKALIDMFPGYQVLFDASNGEDFIEKIDPSKLPDIVLLDIGMPKKDGYATASWLKENHPGVKVIALSTMDAETAIIRMIKLGARGYVLKDAEPEELKLAFSEVLHKGYFFNEHVTRTVMGSITRLVEPGSDLTGIIKLSDRELQFIQLACSEKSYQQIAEEMHVSERTVDGYRESVFKKFGINTRVGLVIYAIKNNLVNI